MQIWNAPAWQKLTAGSCLVAALTIIACQPIPANLTHSTDQTDPEESVIAQAAPLRINELAPDFRGIDSNGATHNLSDFSGKVVVLEWTNHQCPFVRKHYGASNMQTLQAEATDQDVVWLSIISSAPGQQGYVTAAQANELTASRGASPTAVILDPDGQIGRLYSARTTPHMYVIDPQGNLRYMGRIDNIPSADPADIAGATNYVRAALNSLQAGQPVETTVTQPYGCSVKYSG